MSNNNCKEINCTSTVAQASAYMSNETLWAMMIMEMWNDNKLKNEAWELTAPCLVAKAMEPLEDCLERMRSTAKFLQTIEHKLHGTEKRKLQNDIKNLKKDAKAIEDAKEKAIQGANGADAKAFLENRAQEINKNHKLGLKPDFPKGVKYRVVFDDTNEVHLLLPAQQNIPCRSIDMVPHSF